MNVLNEVILGDCIVDGPTQLLSTVTGDLFVRSGGLDLQGMVIGSVIVDAGDVLIGGTVGHDVINKGGRVRVTGTVTGEVFGSQSETRIDGSAQASYGRGPYPDQTPVGRSGEEASDTGSLRQVQKADAVATQAPTRAESARPVVEPEKTRIEPLQTPAPPTVLPEKPTKVTPLAPMSESSTNKIEHEDQSDVTFVETLAEWLPELAEGPSL
ncbi:MAG: hypothetical protein V3V01_16790 [Acidimicrobiales bacterium]